MPVEVNVDERLRQIAEATIAVAQDQGVYAVSYRSVAKRLGGSTTVVTNYLPTRAALLQNAMRHELLTWRADMSARIAGSEQDRFRALALWSCTTLAGDLVLRRMLIHTLAEADGSTEALGAFHEEASDHRALLLEAALADGMEDAERLVDAVYLMCRGFYLSTVEDQASWPDIRAAAAINAIVDTWPRRDAKR